jgi:hypothetical protein
LNPFRNVQIDPTVNLEDLARVAHSLGEVVGLGLRNLAHCPVELNLIPESTRRMQSFGEKKPYLIAAVFSLVAVVGAMGLLFQNLANVKEDELQKNVLPKLDPLRQREVEFNNQYRALNATTNELHQLAGWMTGRYYWGDVLSEIRAALVRTERECKEKKLGVETGVWVEQFLTVMPCSVGVLDYNNPANTMAVPGAGGAQYTMGVGGGGYGYRPNPESVNPPGAGTVPGQLTGLELAPCSTNQISVIKVVCRAVDLTSAKPEANNVIISTLEGELKASTNWFDPKGTRVVGDIVPDETTRTFQVSLMLVLKRPLKL